MDAFVDWISNFDGCSLYVDGICQPKKDRTNPLDYHIRIMRQKLRNGETFAITLSIISIIDNTSCDMHDVHVTISKDINGRIQVAGSEEDSDWCEEITELLNTAM